MSSEQPLPPVQDADEEALDIDAILASPEEAGDYDCSVPEELAAEADDEGAARSAQPIGASCLTEFRAIRSSGTRPLSAIRLIVVHCTESDSARGSARWFTNPDCKGSAHVIVDDRECYRTLDDDVIPWAAPGANKMGWHLELTGWARWNRQQWLSHAETLRRGAHKAAMRAARFGIPVRMLSEAELRRGHKGFVTHVMCTRVFGGSHTDPGPNCPLGQFMQWAQEFAAEM